MCFLDYIQTTLLFLGRFLKKLTINALQWLKATSTISKLIIMSVQLFTSGMDWPEIWYLMEVSIMFDICSYWVLTLKSKKGVGLLHGIISVHKKMIMRLGCIFSFQVKTLKEWTTPNGRLTPKDRFLLQNDLINYFYTYVLNNISVIM